jgi:hypothetical protein
MASSKERARWEHWYTQVAARVERQKQSITRLVFITTESIAALEEIAAMTSEDGQTFGDAVERAGQALQRIKEPAAAEVAEATDLLESEPDTDPRRNPQ